MQCRPLRGHEPTRHGHKAYALIYAYTFRVSLASSALQSAYSLVKEPPSLAACAPWGCPVLALRLALVCGTSVIRGCSCHIRRTERQWIKMQTDCGHPSRAADLPKVRRQCDRFSRGNHEPRRRKTTHALRAGSLRRMGTYAHADGERMTHGCADCAGTRTPTHRHDATHHATPHTSLTQAMHKLRLT